MKFNKKRYRELIKYSQKFDQHEKYLFDISESDYLELLGYSVKTSTRLELELLDCYLNLLEQFLEGKICAGELFSEYLKLQNWQEQIHNRLESNLIILSPQQKVYPVDDLLDSLYWTLEEMSLELESEHQFFEAVVKEESYYEALATIKDRHIYNSIKEIYLQLQNIVKDYRTNCNVSRDLPELVDQLNWENQDQYIELINEFLNGSSNFLNFKERYQSIVRVGKELESNSISLKINYQALGFSNHILILIQLFDSYQIDSRISPKVFKSWVRTLLFEMKNHYSSNFDSRPF
jgi:hypothetical protein